MADLNNRELVLPPGTFAYVLDRTKGRVSVCVGPFKNSLSETDQLVRWNADTQRYAEAASINEAQEGFAVAEQGQYIVLTNPSPQGDHPSQGVATDAANLEVGQRVIVPGPASFPLWPGQTAQTIDGHHLRHNQYVVVRVYDDELARENWSRTVMAPQATSAPSQPVVAPPSLSTDDIPAFTMGQLIVVPGTDVSFYMPSTGTEVVTEGDPTAPNARRLQQTNPDPDRYVRNAVTLETLEYCILLDENGQKRYVRGPAVVFPRPTETFKINDSQSRVFDAIELNEQTGLYIKVIEAYDDDDGTSHPVGEELFITGRDQAIYFPRAEHSIITYSGKRKHHAIAVPAGEGRYVLNRTTGEVELKRGPLMLLPDPRTEVIVRRILEPHDVETMYPGNTEALGVNAAYAAQRRDVSEYLENAEMRKGFGDEHTAFASLAGASRSTASAQYASSSPGQSFMEDTLARGETYSPPRTVTLDTKYEGAVAISLFPGYAVLVTDKVGKRRVEVGPKVILLNYDETIMSLALSTGRPKSDEVLLRTGYLRIVNNVVTDRVTVETQDLVELTIDISYRVNFEGDTPPEQERWFAIENYVQVLTDHGRSRLRNLAKRSMVLDFYTNAIDLIRDGLLGPVNEAEGGRPGLAFVENGMRVYDVEVLGLSFNDDEVAGLVVGAQSKALSGAIELSVAREETARFVQLQAEAEEREQALARKAVTFDALALAASERGHTLQMTLRDHELREVQAGINVSAERRTEREAEALTARTIESEMDAVALARLAGETDEWVKRMEKISPTLVEAIAAHGRTETVRSIVEAVGPAAIAAGITTADMLDRFFTGTPLETVFSTLSARPLGNGRTPEPIS